MLQTEETEPAEELAEQLAGPILGELGRRTWSARPARPADREWGSTPEGSVVETINNYALPAKPQWLTFWGWS